MKAQRKAIPCAHIAQYYQFMWLQQPCIAFNLLRRGYQQWADGSRLDHSNNLYPRKKNPPTTIKQVLVRDFNWRMGNLRRWYGGRYVFDEDIEVEIARLVSQQMHREQTRHEGRLAGTYKDWVLQCAHDQVDRPKDSA